LVLSPSLPYSRMPGSSPGSSPLCFSTLVSQDLSQLSDLADAFAHAFSTAWNVLPSLFSFHPLFSLCSLKWLCSLWGQRVLCCPFFIICSLLRFAIPFPLRAGFVSVISHYSQDIVQSLPCDILELAVCGCAHMWGHVHVSMHTCTAGG
jgi:hypothetical protein